ncbi:MAG: DNRLRE domain-containing protein, partial [Chloroflexi bacterium]|nr:DNRLRE domain-containing protein [Chloroflexota bacterium]
PATPDGIEFVQTIRVKTFPVNDPESYDWNALQKLVRANPGALWQIGNEPDGDRWASCDNRTPTDYAVIFKLFHDRIKAVDPTALIANGPIIEASPVRVDCWLTKVWNEYQRLYGEPMPVDVWNIHEQLLDEAPEVGASIPLTCDPALGMHYSQQQNDSLEVFIDHVLRMRQWMKNHGQRNKPLIVSEYGVMMPEGAGFTQDRVSQFLESTVNFMLYTTNANLGMPDDGDRLVQRWAWYSLNLPMDEQLYNGSLFDNETHALTEVGRTYARLACAAAHPTPTPKGTPLPAGVVREAESGSCHGAMKRATLVSASDCRYVYNVLGSSVSDVTLAVYAPRSGQYALWGRSWATDWNNRTIRVEVRRSEDGLTLPTVEWKVSPGSTWSWDKVGTYSLSAGKWYTFRFAAPVGKTIQKLDRIVVTSNLAWTPGPGDVTVCNPTPTRTPTQSPTPTITRTPTHTLTPTPTRTPMPEGPAGLSGTVSYQGRGLAPSAAWEGPLIVTAHLPEDPIPAYTFNVNSDEHGAFEVPSGIIAGTYDVGVRNLHSLRNLERNVAIGSTPPAIDAGLLREGDANLDNWINALDFSILNATYWKQSGQAGFDARADFNDDAWINALDFSLLNSNYWQQGDAAVAPAARVAPHAVEPMSNVTVRVYPNAVSVADEQVFAVDVYLDAGTGKVDMVDCLMTYPAGNLEGLSIIPDLNKLPQRVGSASLTFNAGGNVGYHYSVVSGSPGVSGTFRLFTLQFRAKQPGSVSLHFTTVTVGDADNPGDAHSATLDDGSITILAATATPTRTNTPPITPVPEPSSTPTLATGVSELVLQQGLEGYSGFADTYIDSYSPLKNYDVSGPDNQQLKLRSGNVKSILLRADLTAIPSNATVDQAWLTLYPTYDSHRISVSVYEVLANWDVRAATWVSATETTPWFTAGCSGADTDRAGTPITTRDLYPTTDSYTSYPFNFVITDLVRQWVADPQANLGLLLASSDSTAAEYGMHSSQSATQALRPRLVIRFRAGTVVTPSPTPTGDLTGTPTPTATPTYTPPPLNSGTIEGSVFEDLVANDSYDSGEPGVPGALVQLLDQSNALVDEQLTNIIGHYHFGDLPAGTYRIHGVSLPAGFALVDPAPRVGGLPPGGTWVVNLGARRTGVLPHTLNLPCIMRGR